MDITIFDRFPDWEKVSRDLESYFNIYKTTNVVIHDHKNANYVPIHNTTLTVKHTFSGNELYQTGKCRFRVNKNNFLVISENEAYGSSIDSEEPVESISVFFNPHFVKDAYSSLCTGTDELKEEVPHMNSSFSFFERLYSNDEHIVPILQKLRELIITKCHDNNIISELLIMLMDRLLVLQNEQMKDVSTMEYKKRSTREELYKRLNNVRDFMYSCFEENITLDDFSKVGSLEKHYLLREFKKYFGVTPHSYLTVIRLQESRKLLSATTIPVTDISEIIGFEYPSSFTSLFKKHTGLSPRKYRESMSSKSQF